ncbi:hypothetical protein B0T25DRAFT_440511, partial [Lasiosphaeria hispida]
AYFNHHHIKDKGKANTITKSIISFQILWLFMQYCAWLPVTLLKFHVLIQIPFIIFAYLCWWGKPLNIVELIVL